MGNITLPRLFAAVWLWLEMGDMFGCPPVVAAVNTYVVEIKILRSAMSGHGTGPCLGITFRRRNRCCSLTSTMATS
ncbi:hypothetical protein DPMN_011987 [Dreissena polymorpha]|uniref:Secreted protein n=1 Tax=Dreissena polymorpha TaxID=45954 RepID=A0A9D4N555_DREPO|nr:hypothetical protein DPMN_011987 [Dreissena polymorpha]